MGTVVSYVVGVGCGIAASGAFAAAAVLQQRVAQGTTRPGGSALGLVGRLMRQQTWLAGIACAVLANGLQALALSAAPLAVVQPLLVCELLFAIPVSARLAGRRLGARQWSGLLAVAVGIAGTVWGAAARDGGRPAEHARWMLVLLVLAAAIAATAALARLQPPVARAALFAVAAAMAFALASALMAATVDSFADNGAWTLLRPAPYGLAVASLTGFLCIQSAFEAGPLAVVMPVLNWVAPLIAVVLGVSVLGESLDFRPAHAAALAVGALVALAGILALDGAESAVSERDAVTASDCCVPA